MADVRAPEGQPLRPEESLRAALEAPWAHHRAGRLDEALAGYAAVGRTFPGEAEPRFRIGLVEAERGTLPAALEALQRAIELSDQPRYQFALGDVLERLRRPSEAIAAWRRAVALQPTLAAAHARLGVALQDAGEPDPAIEHLRIVAQLRPAETRSWNNLAAAFLATGRGPEAQSCARRALDLDPGHATARYNLGRALAAQQRDEQAKGELERAVAGDPRLADAWDALGSVRARTGELLAARQAFERALAIDPSHAGPWVRLADTCAHLGLAGEAVQAYERAEALAPADAARIGSARLFALQYGGKHGRDEVFAAHRDWAAKYAPHREPSPACANTREPGRRLRLGYLSPRLNLASVAFLLGAVIENHDRQAFDVHCYAEQDLDDEVTARIRASGVHWTPTTGLDDTALAKRLQDDGIDIAIDLAGHTPGHRLLALARRPAPVIGTWLDYFNTTGLACVDFLVTDAVHSPPGDGQPFTERLARLPHCRYAWEPPAYAPQVMPPPLVSGAAPVFGSFSRMAKISTATLDTWCEVLRRVPDARLVLKNAALAGDPERALFAHWFTDRGIDAARVEWRGASDHATMLAQYGDIDIGLDTFPYNGGLTTLEALWMGRPVVAVGGDTLIARQSKAILATVGLGELCAADSAGFVAIAEALARDPKRLALISGGLRDRLRASPLLDAAGFTRNLEALYRDEWRRWCAGKD
ncbi:MAG: tetratricopeptide repeat protein [Betaproteobacteria bacterium]|nr:tetratricopeptide repeat protein [Betaproteobacteria bacterium]